jgi:hypothetical protein
MARSTLGVVTLIGTLATAAMAAPTQTTLVDFAGGAGPAHPSGALLPGANGVLYGVSGSGGAFNQGTVFVLSPPAAGQPSWSVQVIYSFQGAADGSSPTGGLIGDTNGVLYGVARSDGAGGGGTVFSLAPPAQAGDAWTETTLHAFTGGRDGIFPAEDAGLVMDTAGALYGTTINGGLGHGTVFRLRPPATGSTAWTETILHAFAGGKDGYFPEAGLLAGPGGVLYGTTSGGGASFTCPGGCGTAFRLTPPAAPKGKWAHAAIHSETKADGADPYGSLVSDAAGNLYGVDLLGGGASACSLGCGTMFRLVTPTAAAPGWKRQTLHAFTSGADSEFPMSALVLGNDGTLWGAAGGAYPNRLGATFSLTPPAAGGKKWTDTIIHTFLGGAADGASPSAGLTLGAGGVLFGVTNAGGSGGAGICGGGCGTMYQIVP